MKTGMIRPGRSLWGGQAGSKWRVLCSDGKFRVATVTGEADTFFTLPARVQVRGRTVTGHVYVRETDEKTELPVHAFSAYRYRKNADALPASDWPSE